jgi:uncharacterized protein (TIGR04222 family)
MPLNPIDWTAGPFLTLYVALAIIVFAFGFTLKSKIGPAAETAVRLRELELAFLAGGARRVGDAVLLALISNNAATIETKKHKITVSDQRPLARLMEHPPLLDVQPDMTRHQFQTAVKPLVERVQSKLQTLGYYPTGEQLMSFRMTVLLPVALLLVFGMIKVDVGSARHHPVGILVMLLFFTGFLGIVLATRPARTRAGREVLQSYKETHARPARAPLEDELIFAVALTGPAVLSGTPYAPVYAASQTMSSGGDGSGSSCGGGGGGGGCGGCGGS